MRRVLATLLVSSACATSLDVVLCRFHEPVADITAFVKEAYAKLPFAVDSFSVYLYSQAPLDTEAPAEWHVHAFEQNAGRESRCYLHHLTHHHVHADHVWFTQALHIPGWMWARLALFTPNTGMLGLANEGMCRCAVCDGGSPSVQAHLSEIYTLATGEMCARDSWLTFYNGEFIVSRRRIQNQPTRVYSYLLSIVAAPDAHWIHRGAVAEGRPSIMTEPAFGHTIERSWNMLFGCFNATQCCRDDCQPGACQCLDA